MATAHATRPGVLSVSCVCMLAFGLCERATAQSASPSSQSFSTLSSRVNAGDAVSVRLVSGEQIVGRFTRASAASLTMMAADQVREFAAPEVQEVVRDRGANRLRRGVLIGVPLGALIGSNSCYRVDTSGYMPGTNPPPSCGGSIAAGMAVGGGIGALIGARVRRPAVVYSAGATPVVGAVREGISAPATVAAPPVVAASPVIPPPPDASLAVLSERVPPFATIYVRTRAGKTVTGTFARATAEQLTMEVDGRPRAIPASDVLEVILRGHHQAKWGALVGLGAGAAIAGVIIAAGSGHSGDSDASVAPAFVIGGAGGGAIWGALIGALRHERVLVYQAAL